MKWEDMVGPLTGVKYIAVIGTPRSGTRISARILANELEKTYIQEEEWQDNNPHLWETFLSFLEKDIKSCVIHAPQLTPFVHRTDKFMDRDDIGFVFVIRKPQEIHDSWSRQIRDGKSILFTKGPRDLCNFYDYPISNIGENPGDAIKNVALFQRKFWEEKQKPKVVHGYELDYDSLKTHHLYMPKKMRLDHYYSGDWGDRSTSAGHNANARGQVVLKDLTIVPLEEVREHAKDRFKG